MLTTTRSVLSSFLVLQTLLSGGDCTTTSSKRGLVYVIPSSSSTSSSDLESDDKHWTDASNGLTWYYNYRSKPTESLASSAQHLQFVPMIWGAPEDSTDTTFLDEVVEQLESEDAKRSSKKNRRTDDDEDNAITHVLGFNEPDGGTDTGGSSIAPDVAASTWLRNMSPLRNKHGIKVGLPAVTGSQRGIDWLEEFNQSCSSLISSASSDDDCSADFIPVHWYGSGFESLASHLGQLRSLYPSLPIWLTEFAVVPETSASSSSSSSSEELEAAQSFFNTTLEYLDRLDSDYVARYSWFGSFRSDASNVGPQAAFLTEEGELTDMGSWYLGGDATGNVPKGAAVRPRIASVAVNAVVFSVVLAVCSGELLG